MPFLDRLELTTRVFCSFNIQGVYARVSGGAAWIKSTSCALGSKAGWCRNKSAALADDTSTAATAANESPVQAPNASTTTEIVTVPALVTVQYDSFPEEFSWEIVDAESGEAKASYPANTFYQPNKLVSGNVNLERGRSYSLITSDVTGDGICCQNGNGFIEISVNGKALVNRWGDVGKEWTFSFTVPL